MTTKSIGSNLVANDLITLAYSLKRPYHKNAVFLVNDSALTAIRKLKDTNQAYMWQPSYQVGEPDRLLGYPAYTSEYMPNIASGKVPVLFGDFSKYFIGQRGQLTFKPLYELHALRDLSTFLMIERIDGVLADNQSLRGLKMK